MIIKQKGPKPSAADRKLLTDERSKLEEMLAAVSGQEERLTKLFRKREVLRKDAESLQRAAAGFDIEAQIKLTANQNVHVRVNDAIAEEEAAAAENKIPLWYALDQAAEVVRQFCQPVRQALLDQIGSQLEPFYTNSNDALYVAQNAPAVLDLTRRLLTHCAGPGDSIARLVEASRDTLRKIDALLAGEVVWAFGDPAEVRAALYPEDATATA